MVNSTTGLADEDLSAIFKACSLFLFLIYCLRLLANTTADLDLWGYLAFGRLFWQTGSFPYQDIFTFVPTHPLWVYHEWLTGVIYYPLYAGFGEWSLQILKNILALSTLTLLYLTARVRGAGFWGGMVMLIVTSGFLKSNYAPVRAQIFTYFFFALTLFLLETSRQQQAWKRLWWLIPIQILWSNMHGGFLAGLGLGGIYAAGEALSRRPFWPFLAIIVPAGLATLINPYGLAYWSYLVEAISMPRPEILEWASVIASLQTGPYRMNSIYFLCIAYFAISLLLWSPNRDVTVYLALGLTLFLGLKNIRHQIFFLMLSAAYLAEPFSAFSVRFRRSPWLQRLAARLDYRPIVIAYLLSLFFFSYQLGSLQPLRLTTPGFSEITQGNLYFYPTGAVDFIRKNGLKGKLLTDFDWGEYLIWNLSPQCLVALDGRYETVYPESVVRPYMDFIFGRSNWQQFLQDYPPDMILVMKNSKIGNLLQADANWRQVFADQGSVLFVQSECSLNAAWEAQR